jgi:hypothetical protein
MEKILKIDLLMFFIFASVVTRAQACPNLSGEYAFDQEWNGKVIIEQSGCESLTLTHVRNVKKNPTYPDGIWTFTQKLKTDGNRYEGIYHSLKLAADSAYTFNTTQFTENRLVLRNFDGQLADCENKYSFNDFECKIFETSYGYDESLKSFTKTQVGQWRAADGSYEREVFTMKKIR